MREHNEIVFDDSGEVVSIETTNPQKPDTKVVSDEQTEQPREILTGAL